MNRPAAVQRDGVRLRKYRIGNVDTSKAELVAFEAFRRFTGVELHPAEVGHLIEKINGEEYWTLSPYSAGEVTNNG